MKANGCNPISKSSKKAKSNPHHSTTINENNKWLKGNDGQGTDWHKIWREDYALDIIGSGGCRSRAIPCTEKEFATFELMLVAKSEVVRTHQDWIGSIIRATNLVGEQIKAMKTKSEIDILAKEYGWEPNVVLNKVFGNALVVNPASVKSMTDSILGYEGNLARKKRLLMQKLLCRNILNQQVA